MLKIRLCFLCISKNRTLIISLRASIFLQEYHAENTFMFSLYLCFRLCMFRKMIFDSFSYYMLAEKREGNRKLKFKLSIVKQSSEE